MVALRSEIGNVRAYQAAKVLTGSREDVLLLAYDTAVDHCGRAAAAVAAKDADAVRASERKVVQVVLLLMSAIDPDRDPVLAQRLLTLYQWCLARLADGRFADPAAYGKVGSVLGGLRRAFAEAAQSAVKAPSRG